MLRDRARSIGACLGACLLASLAARFARAESSGGPLARAREAVANLGYSDARALLEAALKQGGHSQRELLEIYSLRAEVEAVIDGPDASEREFRKLLVIDPRHGPPKHDSPTFLTPYRNALAWVEGAGSLNVEHAPPAAPRTAISFMLVEHIVSDPLAMVAAIEVFYRDADGAPFTRLATSQLRQEIPVSPAHASYYIHVADFWGNVVASIGSPTSPLRPTLSPEAATPPSPPPLARPPVVRPVAPPVVRPVAPAPLPVAPPAPVPAPAPAWQRSKLGWSLVGTGLACALTGGLLFIASANAADTARTATTRDLYVDAHDRAVVFDAAAGTLLGLGIAAASAGVVVLIVRSRQSPPPAAATVWAAPAGTGFAVGGRF